MNDAIMLISEKQAVSFPFDPVSFPEPCAQNEN